MTGSDEDSSTMMRRPSELTAATDLVGLSAPASSVMTKIDDPKLVKQEPDSLSNDCDDDLKTS
eukprot:CAMPEP_0201927358 /NCGR_PEP_ID=MMETSP0903-20130614/18521_1 /ASSEMBLY_ACC=CAM_ASM_000552 /TAXON_ID=420261 /ORGANISM="Thalassiosira antarctica, Strain CCMP982" /LENGTH=62 /DNA_ID=CAMNT_0048465527 /DNA_START=13 /DNA_END=198 /DNA_ORIENTATION=-